MKTTLAVLVLSACAAVPTAAQDEAAIRKLLSDFAAAWNRHDTKAMSAAFAEDGDLINPFGRGAKGRAEIEKFFQDEQTTIMKGTAYKLGETVLRLVTATIALSDWEGEITGMLGPKGEPLPPFKHHVAGVHVKKGGQWQTFAARAYVFTPPPPPAAK